MNIDWAVQECHSTITCPVFRIWKNGKGYYYICKFDYENNPEQYFKTLKDCEKHIRTMMTKFAKEHRLYEWKYTPIENELPGYKEDFGQGLEEYIGVFQAYTCNDSSDSERLNELIDEFLEVI